MFSFARTYFRPAVAALAGAMAAPAGLPARANTASRPPTVSAIERSEVAPPAPLNAECLASTICHLKDRLRWRTPAWSADLCREVADGVLTSAKRYHVPPPLLLAVMINESDMNEKAVRESLRNGELYAKDSGLMGIRCVLDQKGRCTNGSVRGMAWKDLMDPLTNIDVGARELAKWRRAGVKKVTVRVRRPGGRLETKEKYVTCQHKTHAFWAHYNHGPIYLDSGPARHYPHRVAVLYYALAQTLKMDAPDLREGQRITVHDPGVRPRTPDRPVGPRYRKLCEQIRSVSATCAGVAALPARNTLN